MSNELINIRKHKAGDKMLVDRVRITTNLKTGEKTRVVIGQEEMDDSKYLNPFVRILKNIEATLERSDQKLNTVKNQP